ncbi:F-box/LRR-repeat protein [Raphanus sativus]|nr:F-box/LRR-repeat protein [Raphanus sativus]
MVGKKIGFDIFSGLPDELHSHILSFLPMKTAASTSLLSRKWRYLFAYDDRDNPVVPIRIFTWILNVLRRGVSDLNLFVDLQSESLLPSKIFLSETLVRLKLKSGYGANIKLDDNQDVYLPKLKTLFLQAGYENHGIGLAKLLSGCHMLEELVMYDISWLLWNFSSVSITTLKRLTFCWGEIDTNAKSVSIDTPNLVYLNFTDTIADAYPIVNLCSLVEARICLRMSYKQYGKAHFLDEASFSDLQQINYSKANKKVGNATDFIMGIRSVHILYLYADTLEVLTCCCKTIPLFNNLTELTIESSPRVGWKPLMDLLNNSPNLETLVFQGLVNKATDSWGDLCFCQLFVEEEEIFSCLSSSTVKVLKIFRVGDYYGNMESQIEQIKYFLETMPNLEKIILHHTAWTVEDVTHVSRQLKRVISTVASSICIVQLISDNTPQALVVA